MLIFLSPRGRGLSEYLRKDGAGECPQLSLSFYRKNSAPRSPCHKPAVFWQQCTGRATLSPAPPANPAHFLLTWTHPHSTPTSSPLLHTHPAPSSHSAALPIAVSPSMDTLPHLHPGCWGRVPSVPPPQQGWPRLAFPGHCEGVWEAWGPTSLKSMARCSGGTCKIQAWVPWRVASFCRKGSSPGQERPQE